MAADDIRCWIFGSSSPLSDQNPRLRDRLDRFFAQWQAHGEAVAGRWRVLEGRFLVVLRDPEGAEVSGCSIDAMVGQVKEIERELDVRLLDSSRLFYRGAGGEVRSASRSEFRALIAAGEIGPETEVFDTTVTLFSDLVPGVFSKPLRDSWHARLFSRELSAAG